MGTKGLMQSGEPRPMRHMNCTPVARANVTYGSLGAGIGMMMWMWISSIAILFGVQLNAEIDHQTARDSTVHGDKPDRRHELSIRYTPGRRE